MRCGLFLSATQSMCLSAYYSIDQKSVLETFIEKEKVEITNYSVISFLSHFLWFFFRLFGFVLCTFSLFNRAKAPLVYHNDWMPFFIYACICATDQQQRIRIQWQWKKNQTQKRYKNEQKLNGKLQFRTANEWIGMV